MLVSSVSQKGPHAIGMNASGAGFQLYTDGVYSSPTCDPNGLNHAVTLTGYGSLDGEAYWEVKNSWSADWGKEGYVLIARNAGNMCGVASDTAYVIA